MKRLQPWGCSLLYLLLGRSLSRIRKGFRYRTLFSEEYRPRKQSKITFLFGLHPGRPRIRYRGYSWTHSRPSKNRFEHTLIPQEARSGWVCPTKPKILEYPWTQFFAFGASVPKNMKNVFVRTRIIRSKSLRRDEKTRKKGFCAETG